MLWGGNFTDVYIGTRCVACCAPDVSPLLENVTGVEAGLRTVSEWLQSGSYPIALRIWLSGGLCQPFLLPVMPHCLRGPDRQKIAESLATETLGLSGRFHVRINQERGEPDGLAVCMEDSVLQALVDSFDQGDWRLKSIRPWWAEVLRHAKSTGMVDGVLGVQDCDSMTVLVGDEKRFEVATSISPVVDSDSAQSAFVRATLGAKAGGRRTVGRLNIFRKVPSEAVQGIALAPYVEYSQ